MRSVSQTYRTLREAVGSHYEVQIVRGNTTYGMRQILSCEVHQALTSTDDGPSLGAATSSRCVIKLKESSANWPRMAAFTVRVRLVSENGQTTSEWLSFGTFYTDTRAESKYGDLTIEGFDGMMLLERSWMAEIPDEDLPASWPITAAAAGAFLEDITGVELDARDTLDNTVAYIGLDTTVTARQSWATIAAGQGCNAVLTPEGKIHLVPMQSVAVNQDNAVAGIAIAGYAVAGTALSVSGSGNDVPTVSLGLRMRTLDTGPAFAAVTGVALRDAAGYEAKAGTTSGYVMQGRCLFSNSTIASVALAAVSGYIYRPFTATQADLDPAAEPGDIAVIDGMPYQIMQIDWKLSSWPSADIAAPFEQEVDHEYQALTDDEFALRKALQTTSELNTSLRSYIQQTAEEIMQGVAAEYVSDEELVEILEDLSIDAVTAVETQYIVHNSPTTPPAQDASGWSASTPVWTDGSYIWSRTKITKTGNVITYSNPVCIQGADGTPGTDGDDGRGIASLTGQYALGTSTSTAPASGWSTSCPAWESGKYIWTRTMITWDTTPATTSYTTPVYDEALTEACQNAVQAQNTANTVQQMLQNDYSPTAAVEAFLEQNYTSKEESAAQAAALQSEISLTENSLTVAMSELRQDMEGDYEALSYFIRYENGTVIIGRTDTYLDVRISSSQVAICYNGTAISYWNQNKQYTPSQLEIPVGGSLKLGTVQWTPRSTGNVSLLWVGSNS